MLKPKTTYFKLRELFSLRAGAWLLAWAIGIVTLVATVGLLATSGWFISAAAIAGLITGAAAISFDFLRPAAIIRAFAIVRTAGRYGERLASHHAVLALLKDLRCRFFAVLAQSKLSHANAVVQSDQVMHRLITDIEQLDELPLRYWAPWIWAQSLAAIYLVCIWLFTPTLLVTIAPLLLAASLLIPLIGLFYGLGLAKGLTNAAEIRRRRLLQPLRALTSLLLWRQWENFSAKFQQADGDFIILERKQQRMANTLSAIQQSVLLSIVVLLLYQGFALLDAASLSIPMLLALILAVFGLIEVFTPLCSNFTALGFAMASRDRLNQLLPTKEGAGNDISQRLPDIPTDEVCLQADNLSVKHPQAILGVENVNFTLQSGDVLLINGPSGGGKSTLLNALAGELTPQQGDIRLNDRSLEEWRLGGHFGYLAQQVDIFDLSLAENLRLGNADTDEQDLWQVLEALDLADWARAQPKGLQTPLGEYGAAVSGGQARRIALARLLLTSKSILLLDEPFAGLDQGTITHILTELKARLEHGILIIVSHQRIDDDGIKKIIIQ